MKKKYRFLAVSLCLVPVMALAGSKHFKRGSSYTLDDLPAGSFKSSVLRLSPESKDEALRRLRKFDFNDKDVPHMGVSSEGGIFFIDPPAPKLTAAQIVKAQSIAPQSISAVDAFKLHSKLGAPNTIYLDFDGHTITGTAWNSTANPSYVAKAFNADGLPGFSQTELDAIAEIWHRVAEDYAPFNVDVTTEAPLTFGPTVGRALITDNVDANGVAMPASTAGGVAYVNVWGAANYASFYSPALVYANNLSNYAPFITEATSHEIGHNLSLNHDATATTGYYGGHGTGLISWGPIMGTGYNRNVSQWSKGQYPGANNLEDDITLITNRLAARPDDHGDTAASATPLVVSSTGVIAVTNPETDPLNTNPSNKGIINTAVDVDYFSFNAGIGPLNINVIPSWAAYRKDGNRGTNLDVQATLYNAAGAVITQVDSPTDTSAIISTTIATAGTYYLAVTGVGNATPIPGVTPAAPYYSDYGSLGMYYISGSVVPTVINDVTPPTPNPMTWLSTPNANGSSNSIAMTASVASDNSGGPVQYLFTCVSGGVTCPSSAWQTSNQYTATGLTQATTYTFMVQARDASGNVTTASATASATTAVADTQAPTPNPMTWSVLPTAAGSSTSVRMTATLATDNSGLPVQYLFTCVTGTGCVSSPWQVSNQYTALNLIPGTSYSFNVRARDAAGNITTPSANAAAITPLIAPTVTGSVTGTTKVFRWATTRNATSYTYWRCNEVRNATTGVVTCTYPTTPNLTINVSAAATSVSVSTTSTAPIRVKVQARNAITTSVFSNEVRL